jgi:hypothetical protein
MLVLPITEGITVYLTEVTELGRGHSLLRSVQQLVATASNSLQSGDKIGD